MQVLKFISILLLVLLLLPSVYAQDYKIGLKEGMWFRYKAIHVPNIKEIYVKIRRVNYTEVEYRMFLYPYDGNVKDYLNKSSLNSLSLDSPLIPFLIIGSKLTKGDRIKPKIRQILNKQGYEIYKLTYREIVAYEYKSTSEKLKLVWDRELGILLKLEHFIKERKKEIIELVDTNAWEVNYLHPLTSLAVSNIALVWLWQNIIFTKWFVGGLLIYLIAFGLIMAYDLSQRKVLGAGWKSWLPLLLMLAGGMIIANLFMYLLMQGIIFFGE